MKEYNYTQGGFKVPPKRNPRGLSDGDATATFFERVKMKLHEFKEKEFENWVRPQSCMVCKGKPMKGPYGRHEDGWTCSGKCERDYDAASRISGTPAGTPP